MVHNPQKRVCSSCDLISTVEVLCTPSKTKTYKCVCGQIKIKHFLMLRGQMPQDVDFVKLDCRDENLNQSIFDCRILHHLTPGKFAPQYTSKCCILNMRQACVDLLEDAL